MNGAWHFFWRGETPWLIAAALLLTVLLIQLRPAERGSYLHTLGLFLGGLAAQFIAAVLNEAGLARATEVLHALGYLVASVALLRLSGFLVFRLLLPLARLRLPRIVEDLVITAAYVALAVASLRSAGVQLTGILATSAVVTAVLAFAMQDTLGNVLGGLALQLDNSLRIGDWVRLDGVTGRVTDIRWRSTQIETRDWETVLLPNSLLMKSQVTVFGRVPPEGGPLECRRWIRFAIDPAVPPGRIIAIAESAIQESGIEHVSRNPLPTCVLLSFEAGNLNYGLRYFLTDIEHDDSTDSQVRVHLFTALKRGGIRIAEPQQREHSVHEDEAYAESRRRRDLERRLAATRSVDLFKTLSEEERAVVAERLEYAPFARGDVMTRQGNTSHWLYIVASGEAESVLELPGGARQLLGVIPSGGFFGEMGMMTGAPRSSTVIARTDVECYRLDKNAFQSLLMTRPQIAEDISRVMSSRRTELDEVRHEAEHSGARPDYGEALLGRIRRFFGLDAGGS